MNSLEEVVAQVNRLCEASHLELRKMDTPGYTEDELQEAEHLIGFRFHGIFRQTMLTATFDSVDFGSVWFSDQYGTSYLHSLTNGYNHLLTQLYFNDVSQPLLVVARADGYIIAMDNDLGSIHAMSEFEDKRMEEIAQDFEEFVLRIAEISLSDWFVGDDREAAKMELERMGIHDPEYGKLSRHSPSGENLTSFEGFWIRFALGY